jgi:predicted adenylyl cyclase CyaB
MNEFELKIIDVNPNEVRTQLKKLGAKHMANLHYKRLVFPLKAKKGTAKWFRLRTDDKKHTLTLKINKGKAISSTKEYEVMIDDFREAARLLCAAFQERYYEENSRELYSLDKAEITIDKAPFIPHYVEIEAKNEKEVNRVYGKLKIGGKRFGNVPTSVVYKHYGLDAFEVAKRNESKLKKLIGK